MIRPLRAVDAPAVAALIRAAFAAQGAVTDPPSAALRETAETVAAQIASGGGFGAVGGAGLVGAVLWAVREDGLYLGRLAVAPAARGRGTARGLVAAVEAEARSRGLARVVLSVRLTLPGNRAFFAAAGYRQTGVDTHPGYAAPTTAVLEKRFDDAEDARRKSPGIGNGG